LSEDGEEGYPGTVIATVTYEVSADNQLIIEYSAVPTKATPIAMTNHYYWNLAGQVRNKTENTNHTLCNLTFM
jgi:aldose 1-epimerase